ncbi:MAG: DUF4199 domain-containing protein [Ferruginibacter sp.]
MKQTKPAQKGLITGALMILASLLSFYILKNPIESYFQLLVYLIFSLGIIWSLVDYYKSTDPVEKNFKNFFSIGFKTFVLVVLLMAVYTFVFFTYNTDFRDTKIAENSKLIVSAGDHLPNEIEQNEKQLRKMFMPLMISSAVFRYLIIGSIITAITAAFLGQRLRTAGTNKNL